MDFLILKIIWWTDTEYSVARGSQFEKYFFSKEVYSPHESLRSCLFQIFNGFYLGCRRKVNLMASYNFAFNVRVLFIQQFEGSVLTHCTVLW